MYNKRFINDITMQEREIIKLSTEKLELELNFKNKELALKELNVASMKEVNNNILMELKDQLESFSETKNTDIPKMIRTINNSSQELLIWEEFDTRFKEANSEFYTKLVTEYSTLSNNEIRVACLLHENYTTKELSRILHRSPKTIENIRGFLRKKMSLNKNEKLTSFLRSIK